MQAPFLIFDCIITRHFLNHTELKDPDIWVKFTKGKCGELKKGVVYSLSNPFLRALMPLYTSANLLFMGPLALGIPIIVAEQLNYIAKPVLCRSCKAHLPQAWSWAVYCRQFIRPAKSAY